MILVYKNRSFPSEAHWSSVNAFHCRSRGTWFKSWPYVNFSGHKKWISKAPLKFWERNALPILENFVSLGFINYSGKNNDWSTYNKRQCYTHIIFWLLIKTIFFDVHITIQYCFIHIYVVLSVIFFHTLFGFVPFSLIGNNC